jgi:hypothetical protein
MMTNGSLYDASKARALAEEPLTLEEKYRILDALYQEARLLGHFTERDILDGIEDVIRLAAALNANVSKPSR